MDAPALLVIDVQRALDDARWGRRNNPDAEERIAELLAAWRAHGAPVVHVQHTSRSAEGLFRPGTTAFDFKPEARPLPGEPVLQKSVHSPFVETQLEELLHELGARSLVIAGLTTDHCCSTTARTAADLGFDTYFVSDATATFDRVGPDGGAVPAELMHRAALASLHGEFARVLPAREAVGLLANGRT